VRGPQGNAGTNAKGRKGPAGDKGPKGIKGQKGSVNSQGGSTGSAGPYPGPQGSAGSSGKRGASGAGAKGPRGNTGAKGYIGPTGNKGPKGPKGYKGPGAACYSLTIQGPFEEPAGDIGCPSQSTSVYSNCTSIQDACLIYDVSTCTSCTNLSGLFFHDFVDTFNTQGGNPCQLIGMGGCGRSDISLKQDINTLTGVTEQILKMEVKEYDWNETLPNYEQLKEKDKLHSIGLIAQELQDIYPELVYEREDGYYSIYYYKLNAVLIEAVKEQQLEIESIDQDIKMLSQKLN